MPGGVIHLYFKEKKNGVVPKKGAVPIRGAVPIFLMTANRQEKSQNCNCAHTTVQSEGTLVHHLVFRSITSACQTKTGCFQRLDVRAGKMKFVLRCAKRIGRVIQIRTCFTYWTGLLMEFPCSRREGRVVDMEPPALVLKPTPSKGLFDQFSAGAMGPSLTPVPDVDVYALYGYGLMKTLRNFNLPLGLAKVNS